jgi:hypothetical protein
MASFWIMVLNAFRFKHECSFDGFLPSEDKSGIHSIRAVVSSSMGRGLFFLNAFSFLKHTLYFSEVLICPF